MARGNRKKDWIDYTTAVFAFVAAVATVAAAGFTGWQAWIAHDNEMRQLRAYIVVNSARFAKDESGKFKLGLTNPDGSGELLIYYDISNEGITPAYDVFRRITVEYPFKNEIHLDYTDGTAAYVGKQQTFGPVRTRAMTKQEMEAISSGKGPPLVFAGQIIYRDIFERQWPTTFCFMYTATPVEPSFSFCPRFSDSDRLNYAR